MRVSLDQVRGFGQEEVRIEGLTVNAGTLSASVMTDDNGDEQFYAVESKVSANETVGSMEMIALRLAVAQAERRLEVLTAELQRRGGKA